MGRNAIGVHGVRLSESDKVAGACIVDENKKMLVITEQGYGKRSSFDEFRCFKNRGGKGVQCHDTDRTGLLAGIATVSDDDDVMLITNDGTIIRTPVSGISVQSRTAGGVIVMKPAEGSVIVNFALVATEEVDTEAVEAEIEANPLPAEPEEKSSDDAYIETARCSSCNECRLINPQVFLYNENKQAYIANASAVTYAQLVEAAENCQLGIIHPGKPKNPNEPGLDELMKRAEAFA
jgi:ferredoxin